jgi:hypothetical protein
VRRGDVELQVLVPRLRVQILPAARVRLVVGVVLAPEQHQVPRRAPHWRKARHDHRCAASLMNFCTQSTTLLFILNASILQD